MNIFENMYNLLFEECRKAGIRYIWGFTSAQKPFLKLGFEIPYAHSQSLMAKNILRSYTYLSALNPKNTTSSRIKISGLCFLSKINSFRAVFHSGSSSGHKIQVAISTPGEFIDNSTLIQRILAAYPGSFMINQDRGYSDWRLVHNPYHSKLFTITFTDDTGKVATFSFNHHKNGVWYLIQDLSVPELMGRQHAAFLTKAVKALCASEKNGVKLIRTWDFTHHEYARNELSARKKAGFLHLGRGISFVWKCLDNSKPLMPDQFILSRIASQGVI
jgi:hypothetical protein